jgi:hypothetical protein
MGEIKKRRSERWNVTTGGGGDYATEMEGKKQSCLCKYAKPVPVTVNHSLLLNILNAKDEQESRAHR